MIYLDEDKDYFILIDNQGANFASECIFEGIGEVADKFKDWADSDEYEDPTLKDWTIGDCLAHWSFTLKVYHVNDFIEAPEKFLNFTL